VLFFLSSSLQGKCFLTKQSKTPLNSAMKISLCYLQMKFTRIISTLTNFLFIHAKRSYKIWALSTKTFSLFLFIAVRRESLESEFDLLFFLETIDLMHDLSIFRCKICYLTNKVSDVNNGDFSPFYQGVAPGVLILNYMDLTKEQKRFFIRI
jgi:hypothetical protein